MNKSSSECPGGNCGISFADFAQLITYPAYRPTIAALLNEWFGYKVALNNSNPEVLSARGLHVDLKELYDVIQDDPQRRYVVYQAAMTLWR